MNKPESAVLKVYSSTEDAYKSANQWKDFNIVTMQDPECTITFDTDGGSEVAAITQLFNTAVTKPENPTKTGYTFAGWSPELPTTMPSSNITVKAMWTPNKYKVSYIVDGEEYKTDSVAWQSQIKAIEQPKKEGYTFSGWSEIPDSMPDHDLDVTGSFTINKYLFTYKVDGVDYKVDSVAYKQPIVAIATPNKVGYTFSGWSEIPDTMPATDVVVTGTYTINKYKLTYAVDGTEYKSTTCDYLTPIKAEAEPTKQGYTFSGWSEIPDSMPAKDVVITGTFTANKYKLVYMVDDTEYKVDTITYNSPIKVIDQPTKEGYNFSGWSKVPESMPANDLVVTGTFKPNVYYINYHVDGTVYCFDSFHYNDSIKLREVPTKEGYTFSGWSEVPATMPAYSLEVTGYFTINKYKVTYMVDGEEYKVDSVTYKNGIEKIALPTKEGYKFSGWSEIPNPMPAHDVVISGSFTINKYKITFISDSDIIQETTQDYGSDITTPDDPTLYGYTFNGWSPEVAETVPDHDVTYEAQFSINSYNVIYMVDGEEYKTFTLEYGSTITPEAEPAKEGYVFSGWSKIPSTMPANDVTVTGTFAVNQYKLTYSVDGTEYKTVSCNYGTPIIAESEPTKEGYTFSGWSEIPETMPANDVTIIGSYTINQYKVTFVDEETCIQETTQDYGTTINKPSNPTREGYTFTGWSPEVNTTVPSHDVTYKAQFSINSYNIFYLVDGEEYKTVTCYYGADINGEEEPIKEGYTFSGWSKIPATMPAKNVVVTGSFSINSYNLIYMVDGEEFKRMTVTYGTPIELIEEPYQEYYIFSGWSEAPETMPAHDVIVTGTFAVDPDGIMSVSADSKETIYDLNGHKLDAIKKSGIYIVNGRKVWLRK